MSIDRRKLLRNSLGIGAAAIPLGALTVPAHSAEAARPTALPDFTLALVDAQTKTVENYSTGEIKYNAEGGRNYFGKPKAVFSTGVGDEAWRPLECKVRKLLSGETVFMVCGGDGANGRVTIHRQSDAAGLGAISGIPDFFPHSLEYLPTADAIIVVGTRGLETQGLPKPPNMPPPGHEITPGGSYMLFTAPNGLQRFEKVNAPGPFPFRQAHGVTLDQNNKKRVWIYGGEKIQGFEVQGSGKFTKLEPVDGAIDIRWDFYENGHDLQPDPLELQTLWATGTRHLLKIEKAADHPSKTWDYPSVHAKSFSRHRSGIGIFTTDPANNGFGTNKVNFIWGEQQMLTVQLGTDQEQTSKQRKIYKARLTDI
ncbi:hypothetical protein [Streptomyces sp. NPDC058308]|uniref:hypothetical protein n=1 Tax=Streptomyces sp. NPDC058308 TaxID=3346440 RepID=UPI0036E819B4